MDLLRQIRTGRAERRRKAPFRPALYTRVSGLVRRYALDETFLRGLEDPGGLSREEALSAIRLKRKEAYDAPLFSLSTEREHRVTAAILKRVKNPYLQYAGSPDEILVCGSLFRQNPSLHPETLVCHHFETLLLAERVRTQVGRLAERARAILEREHTDVEERSRLALVMESLTALRPFVTIVQDARPK